MAKYIIEIDTANAAFEEDKAQEIASILDTLVEKLESGRGFDFSLRDTNGNKVGTAYLEEDGVAEADADYYGGSGNKGANDD